MTYNFLPETEKEFNDSIDYYESCQKGLGTEFSVEIYRTIERIIEYPLAWANVSNNCRRCMTGRFPYGIIYSIEPDKTILIIAVMNLHRYPYYWVNRI